MFTILESVCSKDRKHKFVIFLNLILINVNSILWKWLDKFSYGVTSINIGNGVIGTNISVILSFQNPFSIFFSLLNTFPEIWVEEPSHVEVKNMHLRT